MWRKQLHVEETSACGAICAIDLLPVLALMMKKFVCVSRAVATQHSNKLPVHRGQKTHTQSIECPYTELDVALHSA